MITITGFKISQDEGIYRIDNNVTIYGRNYEINLYANGTDTINSSFSWDTSVRDLTDEITLTGSSTPREYKHIHYCESLDAIIIHCKSLSQTNSTGLNTPFKLNNCFMKCLRVFIIQYRKDEDYPDFENYDCSVLIPIIYQPEVKKGNILVGQ